MKKMGGNKGFTLVELIIVIAILAIIMLIAIPNFSGIQQRMKVRADKATAAQIGKAVRVWYTDYTSDPVMKAAVDAKIDATGATTYKLDTTPRVYSTIEQIKGYAALTYTPKSLLTSTGASEPTQVYLVNLSRATNDAKIVVGIATAASDVESGKEAAGSTVTAGKYGAFLDNIDSVTPANSKYVKVNYDGTTPGVAYVEP